MTDMAYMPIWLSTYGATYALETGLRSAASR